MSPHSLTLPPLQTLEKYDIIYNITELFKSKVYFENEISKGGYIYKIENEYMSKMFLRSKKE